MNTLYFIVDGKNIAFDSKNDSTFLMPGSKIPVQAEFTFSKEWGNTPKVVGFYSRLGTEYPPQLLKDGKRCVIPAEVLQKRFFKLKVVGQNGMMTNKFTVDQKGG